jgi:hypothetical protein
MQEKQQENSLKRKQEREQDFVPIPDPIKKKPKVGDEKSTFDIKPVKKKKKDKEASEFIEKHVSKKKK